MTDSAAKTLVDGYLVDSGDMREEGGIQKRYKIVTALRKMSQRPLKEALGGIPLEPFRFRIGFSPLERDAGLKQERLHVHRQLHARQAVASSPYAQAWRAGHARRGRLGENGGAKAARELAGLEGIRIRGDDGEGVGADSPDCIGMASGGAKRSGDAAEQPNGKLCLRSARARLDLGHDVHAAERRASPPGVRRHLVRPPQEPPQVVDARR